LVQQTFAEHLDEKLGWESVYAWNEETFRPGGTLGRSSEREVILLRDLRAALIKLNGSLPESAREQAVEKITHLDYSRSLLQHNRELYKFIRNGVPVEWRDIKGETHHARVQVIDFRNPDENRFLAGPDYYALINNTISLSDQTDSCRIKAIRMSCLRNGTIGFLDSGMMIIVYF
jgi:type I restriction enzyme R subunit